MRLWSLHPEYLDSKGLAALWREALLAKNVLEGRSRGYKNHPQLARFKNAERPVDAINQYLSAVYDEALCRGYNFDESKINKVFTPQKLTVTDGQLHYEISHLLRKLEKRDPAKYGELKKKKSFKTHPVFVVTEGGVEEWEKIVSETSI